jgi:hypothetical protein
MNKNFTSGLKMFAGIANKGRCGTLIIKNTTALPANNDRRMH